MRVLPGYAHRVSGQSPRSPHLGTLLATFRERAGFTQEELAERAGLSAHAVSALERGTRTRPYPHTVRSLADALDLSETERGELIAAVPRRVRVAPEDAHAAVPDPGVGTGPRPVGLVVPPTHLFGREDDIRAVAELAGPDRSRLVTLTGPGGVGKTRLLAAVADELAAGHPDGVVHLALAALADATGVLPTIGRALQLPGSDGANAMALVTEHLAGRRLLLVLDNFEHLLSAAEDVSRLVASCPGLTVLVSSRSPLRVRAEQEYAVTPLATPSGSVTTEAELAASPSGALVLDRSRMVGGHAELTTEDVRALAELCVRLAGLPLAIELATARLRLLGPRALLDRLDDVMQTAGSRDLPARQRTMRATLDWSYGLLTSEQQALFLLLGVFRSGTTLERLEQVADASDTVPAPDVLALLEELVDHSLVVVLPGPDGEHRYGMLEPVAQYARSLSAGPDAIRAVHAHARVFADMAEQAAAGFERAEQVRWLALTEADEANLLVAIRRALDTGEAETAARITWSLWLYWWLRGQPSVGRHWAAQCLAQELPAPLHGRVRLTAATMGYAAGDVDASAAHWAEVFRLGTELRDAELRCKSRPGMGLAALAVGDLEGATTYLRDSLPMCEEAGEAGVWMTSLVRVWLGTVRLLQGDPAGAAEEIHQGLRLARSRGDRLTTYVALYNLAQTALAADDHTRAREHLEEGMTLSGQTQDMANLAYFLDSLAVVESTAGTPDRVAVLLGAARSLRDTVGANVYAYYVPDEALRARAEESAREALDASGYEDAVDRGRAMEPADIIRFALG